MGTLGSQPCNQFCSLVFSHNCPQRKWGVEVGGMQRRASEKVELPCLEFSRKYLGIFAQAQRPFLTGQAWACSQGSPRNPQPTHPPLCMRALEVPETPHMKRCAMAELCPLVPTALQDGNGVFIGLIKFSKMSSWGGEPNPI